MMAAEQYTRIIKKIAKNARNERMRGKARSSSRKAFGRKIF